MARVVYSENALANLQRALDFLLDHDPNTAREAAAAISGAIELLRVHPLIGRPLEDPLRELVISFGKTGYVALYRFVPEQDQIRVLALRHQRELDYPI